MASIVLGHLSSPLLLWVLVQVILRLSLYYLSRAIFVCFCFFVLRSCRRWLYEFDAHLLLREDVDVALDALLSHVGPTVSRHPFSLALRALVLPEAALLALVRSQTFAFWTSLSWQKSMQQIDDLVSVQSSCSLKYFRKPLLRKIHQTRQNQNQVELFIIECKLEAMKGKEINWKVVEASSE